MDHRSELRRSLGTGAVVERRGSSGHLPVILRGSGQWMRGGWRQRLWFASVMTTEMTAHQPTLKHCAYCQEDIRLEAIVCRWCARPVLMQAKRLASIGQWYTVGRADDGVWSIWNLVTGGAPVKRFDDTEEGWVASVKEYRKLEKPPANVTWFIGGFVPLDFG